MIQPILDQIKQTLTDHNVDYETIIDEFGQVASNQSRLAGQSFTLPDHIRGLIYAQLSNQRAWGPIAENLPRIDVIFSHYDPEILKAADPKILATQLMAISCGNRAIGAQMRDLRSNIELFEAIAVEYGSMDGFVTSEDPMQIATELGSGKRFKVKQIAFTLAMEYLRNVGISAIKPDLHICRIIGPERLGLVDKEPSPEEAYTALMAAAEKATDSAVYMDNLLWLFAAKDYGNICSATPRCGECGVTLCGRHPDGDLG